MSTIEPELTEKLARRKRPYPEDLDASDSPAMNSDDFTISASQPIMSSNPAHSYAESRKRVRASSSSGVERGGQQAAWRQNTANIHSSPLLEHAHTMNTSYPSLQDSPMFDAPSTPDANDHDNNLPPMQEPSSSVISSSPPRTPPPNRRNLASTKQAGADLLLYLGQSPQTPAVHVHHISSTTKENPSTPPHQSNLPSSFLQTPSNLSLFNGALQTPGNFNLADFCNVTPSPAQAPFNVHETPGLGRTPCRSTRRNLNFDALAPPSTSTQKKTPQNLTMQLGEALGHRPDRS